jgi:hypothetical protein
MRFIYYVGVIYKSKSMSSAPPPSAEDTEMHNKIKEFNDKLHSIDTDTITQLYDAGLSKEADIFAFISGCILAADIVIDKPLATVLTPYYVAMLELVKSAKQSGGRSRRKSRRGTRKLNKHRK